MARMLRRRAVPSILITVLAGAGFGAAPPAGAATTRTCAPVRLTGVGQDLGPDASGVLHTTATILLAGAPIAMSNASFTPGVPDGSLAPFSGPIVFSSTSVAGTVTAPVDGAVDLATGKFSARSTAVSGTGVLASVRGRLSVRGQENLATGAFTESLSGRLCAPA